MSPRRRRRSASVRADGRDVGWANDDGGRGELPDRVSALAEESTERTIAAGLLVALSTAMGTPPTIQPRLFTQVLDLPDAVTGLRSDKGLFVPTRMSFELGQELRLTMRLAGLSEPVVVPARVRGRRCPKGAGPRFRLGVWVTACDANHPALQRLAASAGLEQAQPIRRCAELVSFEDKASMVRALARLARGQSARLPLRGTPHRGDCFEVRVRSDDHPVESRFVVRVASTIHVDDESACQAIPADELQRRHITNILRRMLPDGGASLRPVPSAAA